MHIHICMHTAFGEIPGHAAALLHPPRVSVKRKSRWEGHFPLVNPPVSAPLHYVPLCHFWPSGQIKTCVLVGRTKAQAESEKRQTCTAVMLTLYQ